MYVCMYVRMYVCMYVCNYVCMYVRTYVRTYVCMYDGWMDVCVRSCNPGKSAIFITIWELKVNRKTMLNHVKSPWILINHHKSLHITIIEWFERIHQNPQLWTFWDKHDFNFIHSWSATLKCIPLCKWSPIFHPIYFSGDIPWI